MSWEKDIKEIKKREKLSLQQGGKEAIDKQHAKGRKTLRERIDFILDEGSFDEIGKIAGSADLNDNGELKEFTPANFLLGFGKINKRDIKLKLKISLLISCILHFFRLFLNLNHTHFIILVNLCNLRTTYIFERTKWTVIYVGFIKMG